MKTTISMENILLTGIELAVKWSDETESFIALKTLRNCCPCAFWPAPQKLYQVLS